MYSYGHILAYSFFLVVSLLFLETAAQFASSLLIVTKVTMSDEVVDLPKLLLQ
jgi:hypothetical protein